MEQIVSDAKHWQLQFLSMDCKFLALLRIETKIMFQFKGTKQVNTLHLLKALKMYHVAVIFF